METARARLSELEARIMDPELSMSALRSVLALVQKRLGPYSSLILTLPHEITAEIFINFLPVYPAVPPLCGLASPTCLTHVCRQWREIALATPALWRAIELDINRIPFKRSRRIFDAWARRSGSLPLSLYIDLHDHSHNPEYDENLSDHERMYKKFVESSVPDTTARWEHLALRTSFIVGIPRPIPSLRSLDFSAASSFGSSFGRHVTFDEVPQLRTVVLHEDAIGAVTVPWIQLTSLTLVDVSVYTFHDILRETSNLVHCSLTFNNDNFITYDNTKLDLAFPRLESLVLETMGPTWKGSTSTVDELLMSFAVPSLRKLESEEVFIGPEPILGLQAFISKTGCRLQEVCITRDIKTPQESYLQAFASIPAFLFSPTADEVTDDEESGGDDDSSSDSSD